MDKKEFEAKFRDRIVPDNSSWQQRAATNRANRDDFRRSQRVALRILDFLDNNPDWSRQRLADELNVSLQRISIILKGKANFTLSSIETLEKILGINLLDQQVTFHATQQQYVTAKNYEGTGIDLESLLTSISATYVQQQSGWLVLGEPNFSELYDSKNCVAA